MQVGRVVQLFAPVLIAAALYARAVPAANPDEEIAALLTNSSALQRGRIGFKFVDVESGGTITERDADKFFIPASNAKLYTTAAAICRLGPDYIFRTELRTPGRFQPGQEKISDLMLIGGGDPNFSARFLPYLPESPEGDALAPLKTLADRLYQAGIREVHGDVIGTAARYPGDLYPDGWTIDDSNYSYGAPVSALSFNDNTVSVIIRPSFAGEKASLEVLPATRYFTVRNQVITTTGKDSDIKFRRTPGSRELVIWGRIGNGTDQWRQDLGVPDPAAFAAEAFTEVLRSKGISVRGYARGQYVELDETRKGLHENQRGTLLVAWESAPLSQTVQVVNKVSQNLQAEMLLREVAFKRTGLGTLENGLKEREAFLREAGVTRDGTGFALADGSGLARQDLTTPNSTVTLLRYMWLSPDRTCWIQSLPVGSIDGSLEHRFRGIAGAQRVHAKTGSLSHVNALSGYMETQGHRTLAFSVMVNGTVARDADVRKLIDRICAVFLALN